MGDRLMAEFQTIVLTDIIVPERLRAVEEDHALAIQASIVEHGQINPITVRRTPPATKPFKPYTLIAGAHRMRAIELLGLWEIEAVVLDADREEAQLLEISENLFRNELSALDRAMFVLTYREVWERKHGKIRRGGDQTAKLAESPLDQIANEAEQGFSVHVAEKLGVSKRAVERWQTLGQKLDPALRQKLRGTAEADNQSLLLKLARMEPARQRKVATAIEQGQAIPTAIELTDTAAKAKATKSEQEELFDRLVATWARADEQTKARFRAHIRPPRETLPTLSELLAEGEAAGGRASRPGASHDLRRDRG